jgi:hypothetical protein
VALELYLAAVREIRFCLRSLAGKSSLSWQHVTATLFRCFILHNFAREVCWCVFEILLGDNFARASYRFAIALAESGIEITRQVIRRRRGYLILSSAGSNISRCNEAKRSRRVNIGHIVLLSGGSRWISIINLHRNRRIPRWE